jgi:hypothetical protein
MAGAMIHNLPLPQATAPNKRLVHFAGSRASLDLRASAHHDENCSCWRDRKQVPRQTRAVGSGGLWIRDNAIPITEIFDVGGNGPFSGLGVRERGGSPPLIVPVIRQ